MKLKKSDYAPVYEAIIDENGISMKERMMYPEKDTKWVAIEKKRAITEADVRFDNIFTVIFILTLIIIGIAYYDLCS